jgi:hypothetical protein
MAQASDRQEKKQPLTWSEAADAIGAPFDLIIPCRDASPQSPALFHQATEFYQTPEQRTRQTESCIAVDRPASARRPKEKIM